MYKAEKEYFLDHSVDEIESLANNFVGSFANENSLAAHTLSAYRWYFQSDEHLLEDDLVEPQCQTGLLNHKGTCTFNVVDIAVIDSLKHN